MGKENYHDVLYLKPISDDQFWKYIYIENASIKTKPGCVSLKKLLHTLKGSCSLFEECRHRITDEHVNRVKTGVTKVSAVAHRTGNYEGECILKGTEVWSWSGVSGVGGY